MINSIVPNLRGPRIDSDVGVITVSVVYSKSIAINIGRLLNIIVNQTIAVIVNTIFGIVNSLCVDQWIGIIAVIATILVGVFTIVVLIIVV